ncbi:hypothetical protein ABEB36_010544 [Hypothenemus hampei]|uniref:Uncharacterized protein n=1 Tax=Hypothenemus hampei TaxID=57062 RepID=A0ABD1EKM5_HYPHA
MGCKKCGNDDHQKPTSYLCPEQDKKQKDKFCTLVSDPNFGTDLFTVNCGFQKFCPNVEIRRAIEDDVRVLSDMMIDASLYINYYFTKFLHERFEQFPRRVEPHFLCEFYYHLQSNSDTKRKVVFPKDEYYFVQMRGANRPLYDASHRGYLIQSACVVHYMYRPRGGACVRDSTGEEIEVKLKAAAFMNTACEERVRKHKLKKLTRRHERFLDMERDSINKEVNIVMTPKVFHRFFNNVQYIKFRLDHFELSQSVYCRKCVTRLNFDSYIHHIRALDQLVSTLLPVNRFARALISFSDRTLTPEVSYGKNKIPAINALFRC